MTQQRRDRVSKGCRSFGADLDVLEYSGLRLAEMKNESSGIPRAPAAVDAMLGGHALLRALESASEETLAALPEELVYVVREYLRAVDSMAER